MAGSQHKALSAAGARERWKYSRYSDYEAALQPAISGARAFEFKDQDGPLTISSGAHESLPATLQPPANVYPLLADVHRSAAALSIIEVSAEAPARLSIRRCGGAGTALLRLAPGAQLALQLDLDANQPSHSCIYLELGANAQVTIDHSVLNQDQLSWSFLGADLARDARLTLNQHCVGAGRHRFEVLLRLNGAGAHAELSGAILAASGARIDQQVTLEHTSARATSQQRFHCVADRKAVSTFNGRIHIHPGAPGTRADLTNRNLMLDEAAEINTKPELEIYTDDVQCSHGSTVGQLDQDALFYLRARGIAEPEARQLMITAFLERCIQGSRAEAARDAVAQFVRPGPLS